MLVTSSTIAVALLRADQCSRFVPGHMSDELCSGSNASQAETDGEFYQAALRVSRVINWHGSGLRVTYKHVILGMAATVKSFVPKA
jgi:hypothetical protein